MLSPPQRLMQGSSALARLFPITISAINLTSFFRRGQRPDAAQVKYLIPLLEVICLSHGIQIHSFLSSLTRNTTTVRDSCTEYSMSTSSTADPSAWRAMDFRWMAGLLTEIVSACAAALKLSRPRSLLLVLPNNKSIPGLPIAQHRHLPMQQKSELVHSLTIPKGVIGRTFDESEDCIRCC